MTSKNQFFYPHFPYKGQGIPEHLAFNAHLQEFSQKVDCIVALQTGGKLSPQSACQKIRQLWDALDSDREALGIEVALPADR